MIFRMGGWRFWKGRSAFDKLLPINHAAIVENKRLGEILAWIKEQQGRQAQLQPSSVWTATI